MMTMKGVLSTYYLTLFKKKKNVGHPLNGTKFFTWGDNGPGRFMQDFLAGGGKREGDYTELQVGPAP